MIARRGIFMERGSRFSFTAALGVLAGSISWASSVSHATPALLLHTPGYEAPVRGGPEDLLMLCGYGFEKSDQVVYEALHAGGSAQAHPSAVPHQSTAELGIAPVVQIATPAYALTVRLPEPIVAGQPYRLWVVNRLGEWSAPVVINDPRPLWITP